MKDHPPTCSIPDGRTFYSESTARVNDKNLTDNAEALSKLCDRIRKLDRRIRHVGRYDRLGRILYDSIRENRTPLEGTEEMHILNGTVASMLNLWLPANSLLGKIESFIMTREKIVALIVPHTDKDYFLVVFEGGSPLKVVEQTRTKLLRGVALIQ